MGKSCLPHSTRRAADGRRKKRLGKASDVRGLRKGERLLWKGNSRQNQVYSEKTGTQCGRRIENKGTGRKETKQTGRGGGGGKWSVWDKDWGT